MSGRRRWLSVPVTLAAAAALAALSGVPVRWYPDAAAELGAMIGATKGWQLGVLPFLVGDVVKSALGAATLALWHSARAKLPRA